MARQRTIVGLGEALLAESPQGTAPAGLAAEVALTAVRLGHRGVPISRIGQDEAAEELLKLLREAGVDTSHVQSDPDLPTARLIVRGFGGAVARYVEERAAFDNLQWDFDLEDISQQADGVVFGLLSRRGGQTRSEENRFLAQCSAAMKVFDLTNRGPGPIDRSLAQSGLGLSDAIVVDPAAVKVLLPGAGDQPLREAAEKLRRSVEVSLVLAVEAHEGTSQVMAMMESDVFQASVPDSRPGHIGAIVALLHGVLGGRPMNDALALAERISRHLVEQPESPVPQEML